MFKFFLFSSLIRLQIRSEFIVNSCVHTWLSCEDKHEPVSASLCLSLCFAASGWCSRLVTQPLGPRTDVFFSVSVTKPLWHCNPDMFTPELSLQMLLIFTLLIYEVSLLKVELADDEKPWDISQSWCLASLSVRKVFLLRTSLLINHSSLYDFSL